MLLIDNNRVVDYCNYVSNHLTFLTYSFHKITSQISCLANAILRSRRNFGVLA